MILNLVELSSRFSINIIKTAVKYNKNRPVSGAKGVKSVIIVAEGTVEAKIFTLLAHHLNGLKKSTILKPPKGTGLDYLVHLPMHLKRPTEIITVVVDQDSYSMPQLLAIADPRLQKHGFTRTNQITPHCYEYTGTHGGNPYTIYLLINCCPQIQTTQHTIEDHLLQTGNITCTSTSTSKQTWRGLPPTNRDSIMSQLANGGTGILRNNFPQHYQTIQTILPLI